jgi:Na+/H+-dicarboxylate symporter
MLRKMPVILLIIVAAIILLHQYIPHAVYQFFYAFSLSIESLIVFLLPLIIFGLLFRSIAKLADNATKIIGLILVGVFCSHFVALLISYFIGEVTHNFNMSILIPDSNVQLIPSWRFAFPQFVSNYVAMFAGILMGIITNWTKNKQLYNWLNNLSLKLEKIIFKFFTAFIYLIPLFVTGFIMKLQYDGLMTMLFKDYTVIFVIIVLSQLVYLSIVYWAVSSCRFNKCLDSIKNMLPAGISGFITMSSAVSMPLTIAGAEKNGRSKDLAHSVIPATVNIHLVGDCFTIPILIYAILKNYSMPDLTLLKYAIFCGYFFISRFSVAAIPGGGVVVIVPVLSSYLGFSPDMAALITGLYILFDPVNTCVNVLGNGAFAKLIDNIVYFLNNRKSAIKSPAKD